MTKTDFDSKYSPIVMPEPFAGSGNKTLPANTQDDASGFSYPLGFNGDYSSPSSNNGKFVTRKQMNAIGNLATHNDFHHRCGGLNTFDPAFAALIGGYPKGAILQYFDPSRRIIRNLVSLVDDNLSDFTSGPIDNTKWGFADIETEKQVIPNSFTLTQYKEGNSSGGSYALIDGSRIIYSGSSGAPLRLSVDKFLFVRSSSIPTSGRIEEISVKFNSGTYVLFYLSDGGTGALNANITIPANQEFSVVYRTVYSNYIYVDISILATVA
jgi:hypothetical protein